VNPVPAVRRRTLGGVAVRTGVGIHTGADASVRLHPAPDGTGILFRVGGQEIPAQATYVIDTSRCTVLGAEGVTLSTVEHLLSAFAGLGVTDAIVEVEGPELPIGDGSAALWAEAVLEVGTVAGDAAIPLTLTEPIVLTGKGGSFVAAYPAFVPTLTVAISFEHPLIGTQVTRFSPDSGNYAAEIAPARTFGLIEEVEALLAAGLAKGGSFDNAVVVYPDRYSVPLRFEDELARHKLLDLMGDLLLSGGVGLPNADIIAVKPSHRLNAAFAARLANAARPGGADDQTRN
jgi:UDP-3-O-[3-hydroxymyristoyl] N-acetylglucosamine deacetylase